MKYAPHVECPERPGQMEGEGEGEGWAYANGADGEREGKGRWGWGSAESLNDESGEGRAEREAGGRQSITQLPPSFTECCLCWKNKKEKQTKNQTCEHGVAVVCAVASQSEGCEIDAPT